MHTAAQLIGIFEQRFGNSLPFPQKPETLYEPCKYFLKEGGKRIRPALCLMANELFGEITEDAWYAACAIELFHNFTLIHDDIMDKSPLRRGNPTVHAKYGLTAGILCGDVMNIYAYEQLAKIKKRLQPVLQVFIKTGIEVCEGQQLDMDFEARGDVGIEEYINMISLKTSVLLAGSLKIGAILGGSLDDNANKLYEFGKNLGICFQLQDDFLDAFGDTEKTGKQNGGDIKANKKTCLYIIAHRNATEKQRQEMSELTDINEDERVSEMLHIFETAGAKEECSKLINHYSERAFMHFEAVALPTSRKSALHELAMNLLHRDK